ncbi:MAG TPA: TetR/AcrR family transcriptional regulator, partial [Thermoanaerobaculia bacterium]|nr:TetR/AcrR family transcriptional regulator [Thermoanaerobaculia bacterium]
MGPRERRVRERDEIREKILDAARDLLVGEGYDAVTMRRIAEKIEYSPTAIYFHFRDKEALLKRLCEHDFLSLPRQFLAIQEIADPIEKLKATGKAYLQFGIDCPHHYRLMFMTPHPPITEHELEKNNPEEDAYAFLKAIVAQAIAAKRFKPEYKDVDLVAQTVWAGVHGAVSLHIAKCNDDWVDWRPLKNRAEVMIDVLVNGLAR